MGVNVTEKANCQANGFHSAENPLDCFTYYSDLDETEFYLVDARGDIDEDCVDTKIACTELDIIKKLSREEVFLYGLAYMVDHPFRKWSSHVRKDRAKATNGYAVVRGIDPLACGELGDILALAKENPASDSILQVALARVDGRKILPGVWYGSDLTERQVA
jgi:hypothetical protein